MFKKALALALAAVMLLMPMTASAVTWNQLVTGLRSSGTNYYKEENTTIELSVMEYNDEKLTEIVVTGGEIEFDRSITAYDDDSQETLYCLSGVTSELVSVIGADGQAVIVVLRDGSAVETFSGFASEGQYVRIASEGTVGTMYVAATEGGQAMAENNWGTVTEGISGNAYDEGSIVLINDGTAGYLSGNAEGGSSAQVINGENGNAQSAFLYGDTGSSLTGFNYGEVEQAFNAAADSGSDAYIQNAGTGGTMMVSVGEDSTIKADNYGTLESAGVTARENGVGELVNGENGKIEYSFANAQGDAQITFRNDGADGELFVTSRDAASVEVVNNSEMDFATADLYDDAGIAFTGTGSVAGSMVYVNVPSTDTYTAEQIQQILAAIGLNGTEESYTQLWTMDENGEFTAVYEIAEDGTLTLIEVLGEEEEEEPYVEPDPVEELRQLEGIGGVTTSPVWNWQGYLGHSSKPMWIYVNGEKVLMRQRLFWLGDSTKNHTCRINIGEPDPASVELRIGLDMLRTAQRAEISVISILDKEENLVAQFAVSDLMAAFEQYGLVEGELLCVSADGEAEVMKVTLEGEYLPIEE